MFSLTIQRLAMHPATVHPFADGGARGRAVSEGRS